MSKNEKDTPKFDTCKSCTGALLYSDSMKSNKKGPICIGIIGKPSDLKNHNHNDKDQIDLFGKTDSTKNQSVSRTPSSSSSTAFLILGYSQYYNHLSKSDDLKMYIKGYKGIWLVFEKEEQIQQESTKLIHDTKEKLTNPSNNNHNNNNDDKEDDKDNKITSFQLMKDVGDDIITLHNHMYSLVRKGANMQITNMKKFPQYVRQYTKGLPQRMFQRAKLIYESSKKTAGRVYKGAEKIIRSTSGSSGGSS